jgi:primosomal protein N' (replication factor Y)
MTETKKKILIIHPRKGFFSITVCQNKKCKHQFVCENCDAKLVSYRQGKFDTSLICHQCQSKYPYPKNCPNCNGTDLTSFFGGIEKIEDELKNLFINSEVIRLDSVDSYKKIKDLISKKLEKDQFYLTTRIFDPAIDYSKFDSIIVIQSENLLASADYLVTEEIFKQVYELLTFEGLRAEVVFDKPQIGNNLFNFDQSWVNNFYSKEINLRQRFDFPPFVNLLLVTVSEVKKENAYNNSQTIYSQLIKLKDEFENLAIVPPYPAKFLKRRNIYSYHILIRFPKKYDQYQQFYTMINSITLPYKIQLRLNPKHVF